jgi:DNA-binding transcriptional ArsR family regulator
MSLRFSKLPSWWIRQNYLRTVFRGGSEVGTSIAALKCVIGISLVIDFRSRRGRISISELEDFTGLSRPMVQRGIKLLETMDIIEIDRGHANEYTLTELPDDSYWTKLPVDRLKRNVSTIPNRGIVPLTALKIYLLLLSFRKNDSVHITMPYDFFCSELGIQRSHIRSALDILYSHKLLHVSHEPRVKLGSQPNVYTILGLERVSEPKGV